MHPVQIYSASAGSGKTFTLVREYLKVLFEGAGAGDPFRFRQVLAITFTNKATAEMKQRILAALREIARGEETALLEQLQASLPGIEDFPGLARQLLRAILRDYPKFQVQTIDSFFQDIVRSVARELDLPLNYEIDVETDKGLRFAVDEVFREIGVDQALTRWLETYALSLMQSGKSWDFYDQLKRFGEEVFNDKVDLQALSDHAAHMEAISKRLHSLLAGLNHQTAEAARELKASLVHALPETAFQKAFLTNLDKASGGLEPFDAPPSDTFLSMLGGKKSPLLKNREGEYGASLAAFRPQLESLHGLLTNGLALHLAAREARFNIYAMGVVDRIHYHLKRYRMENNRLFLADAARLIQGFIERSDTPFLFEKAGSRITHLFIDEFQDTSSLQWQNVLPVLHHLLSMAEDRMAVTLVGDAKQSIYRWRGGDLGLITGGAAESLYPYPVGYFELDTNRRSLPEIVGFNNAFFETVKDLTPQFGNPVVAHAVAQAYAEVRQQHLPASAEGYVSIEFLDGDGESGWKEVALQRLEAHIGALREAGYAYSDMAILVRKRQDGVAISRFLQGLGIDVLSAETLLLKFDREVQLLLAGLYYVVSPEIPLYYANLVWHYARRKAPGRYRKSEIFADHGKRALMNELLPDFADRLEALREMHAWQLVEFLIRELGLDAEENLFLGQFRQLAYDYCKSQSTLPADLLTWWEEEKDKASAQMEEGGDRIHVLTIHKSKGLEFPAVLIPFCDWPIHEKLHEKLLWPSDSRLLDGMQLPVRATKSIENSVFGPAVLEERSLQWIDSLNLLYVAFTRARETLLMCCPTVEDKGRLPVSIAELMSLVTPALANGATQHFQAGRLLRPPTLRQEPGKASERLPARPAARDPLGVQLAGVDSRKESRIGEAVHRAASYLGHKPSPEAIRKALEESPLSLAEEADANKHFQTLSGQEQLAVWLSEARRLWSEQDIWYEGRLLRPDKVLHLPGKLVVIDFKTGDVQDAHEEQVRLYAAAIARSFPGEPVEGYVLYTATGRLVRAV